MKAASATVDAISHGLTLGFHWALDGAAAAVISQSHGAYQRAQTAEVPSRSRFFPAQSRELAP